MFRYIVGKVISKFSVAMSRCQSTPGLVESHARVPLEDMLVSPLDEKLRGYAVGAGTRSLFTPSSSPVLTRTTVGVAGVATSIATGPILPGNNVNVNVNVNNVASRSMDSPMSATSSGQSSEDPTARMPRSVATQPSTGRQSTHSGESIINDYPFGTKRRDQSEKKCF